MHIPDGFFDPTVSVAAVAVALPAVAVATRRAGRQLADREIPLAGLVVAYLVVAQLLVFPVGLGTSAHLIGTGLALVLVGPWVTTACVTIVLVLQSLLFADGGISALGLNLINTGLVPIAVGWAVLTIILGRSTGSRQVLPSMFTGKRTRSMAERGVKDGRTGRIVVAAGLAAGTGAFAGAVAFCIEYAIGHADDAPAGLITTGFLSAYVVVAVIEGVLTALIIGALLRSRPDLVLRWRRTGTAHRDPHDPVVVP
jgi:cobalt/nickel transport system permease protein